MAKRKRENSSGDSGSNAKSKDNGEPSREKKRRNAHSLDLGEICSELYETIRNHKDNNGRVLCESFIRVPKRRNCPDYYQVVTTPMDLLKIQQRVKTEEYEDLDEVTKDFELLFNNAKSYYSQDSQEYNDACTLAKLYEETKKELSSALEDAGEEEEEEEEEEDGGYDGEGDKDMEQIQGGKQHSGASNSTPDKPKNKKAGRPKGRPTAQEEAKRLAASCMIEDADDGNRQFNPYEEMLEAVISLRDHNGRVLCELFKTLPPQEFYPEYYKIIKEPTDLKTICQNYKNNMYKSIEDLERDLHLMVKNAHTFNEPGSQIYRDATAIKKVIVGKKSDIDHVMLGTKTSERLSGKRTYRDPGKRARRSVEKGVSLINALIEGDGVEYAAVPQVMDQGPEEEYEEDTYSMLEGEDEAESAEDNPMMALFTEIYNFVDATGRAIAEPFLRLPSRRAYPDYYNIIKNPIGLLRIRSNIKNSQYDTLDDAEKDIEQCFINAQTYNEPNSMLHKDALRLLEVMRKKKRELLKLLADKGITVEELKKREASTINKEIVAEEEEKKGIAKKMKKTEDTESKLKKRMRMMYKAVENYQDEAGRYLSDIFMELPPKEEYPDYYEVISEPICLSIIENNIRDGKYKNEDDMMIDFEIMFDNARYYNEEDSQVYQDANTLDKILKKKKKSLGPMATTPTEGTPTPSSHPPPGQHTPQKHSTPTKKQWTPPVIKKYSQIPSAAAELKSLCRDLFNAVKDCSDKHGRQLCLIFQRLPARTEYPDYYTLIKKPIDMAKINSKLNSDQYANLEDFLNDFYLMFDNACKYNEPDSQVYKDALELQRELLRKKHDLIADEGGRAPNVQGLVQKLLRDLFSTVIDHQDEEGRCFSDSLAEVTCYEKGRKISLKTIGINLRKCRYTRLDKMQEDLFLVFEKARSTSRVDSEMYEDSSELQLFYMTKRDELCKMGERFVSPALSFTKRHLQQELDEEKKKRLETETQEDDKKGDDTDKKDVGQDGETELSAGDLTFVVGDFCYVRPREEGLKPHIVMVEKLWKDIEGEKWLYGPWFYRPAETFHLATRKFLEKEVFRSDYSSSVKLSDIVSKCHVMFVKEYFKNKPEGFNEEDVYVCESKYYVKPKAFKKIKLWSVPATDVRLIPREEPLVAKRVPSVFACGTLEGPRNVQEGPFEDTAGETEDQEIPDDRKNITIEVQNPDFGCTYYEQLKTAAGFVKLGDCVYVRSDENYFQLARVDKMWVDRGGNGWFHGPWFVSPVETIHLPTKMFYDKEVFFSSVEETSHITTIAGLCYVLQIREFTKCRPTEIPEKDVYLCESRYDEAEGHIRKLKGLKRVPLSLNVQEDEWYFFEDAVNPARKPSPLLASEKDLKSREERAVSPSVGDDKLPKQRRIRGHSGYLLFSNKMRSVVKKEHPEYSFGQISRVIGVEWRNLNGNQKAEYETRAQMQLSQLGESTEVPHPITKEQNISWVYDCLWANCDHQYQDLQDLVIHVLESGGHIQINESHMYPCLWATCHRMKRGFKPFPSASKLARHLREIHLRCEARQISVDEQSKNYFPTHQAALILEPEPEPEADQQRPTVSTPSLPTPTMPSTGGSPMNLSQPVSNTMTPQPMQGFNNQAMRMMPNNMQQGIPHQQQFGNNMNYPTANQPSPMVMNRQPQHTNNMGVQQNIPGPNTQHMGMMQGNQFMAQQQQQQHQPQQFMQQQPQQQPTPTPPHPQHMMQQQMMQSQQYQQHVPQYQPQAQVPYNQPQHNMIPPQAQTPPIPQQNGGPHGDTAPIFIAPPPKTEKLRHSEAYLRYIEGMRDGSPHLSNWNVQRRPDLTPQQISQLPVHWLGSGYGRHENAVDAMWALRDYMLQDALSLSKLSK